jgi:hypothetical protein
LAARMVLVLMMQIACSDGGDSDAPPALELLSPTDGDTVCGTPLVVETRVTNFTLTNEDVEDPPPGQGHLHVYLNGQEVAQAGRETVEITGVKDGEYQLKTDLAQANHEALDPYVGTDPIYITIDAKACAN